MRGKLSRGKLLALFIALPLPVVVIGFIVASNEASDYDQLQQGDTRRSPKPVAPGAATRLGTSIHNDGSGRVDLERIGLVPAGVAQVTGRRVRTDAGEATDGLQRFRRVEILPGQERYVEFELRQPPCAAGEAARRITGLRLKFDVEHHDQTRTLPLEPPATIPPGTDC